MACCPSRWRGVGERSECGSRSARDPRQVLGLVFQQAMRLVALGLLFGTAGVIAMGRLVGATIFGIRPVNPLIPATACCVLAVTGMAAAYLPAARAASVDPMEALRSE